MNRHLSRIGAAAAAVSLSVPAAWAADNCTGTYSHVIVSSETIELAEGVSVTSFLNQGSSTSADSMYAGAGSCAGYVLRMPDGKRTVAGTCARKHKNGDTWSFTWSYGPSGDGGTWQSAGGTGGFAGKRSSGWFKNELRDGKVSMGSWGGICE